MGSDTVRAYVRVVPLERAARLVATAARHHRDLDDVLEEVTDESPPYQVLLDHATEAPQRWLAALSALREKPAGVVRITAGEHPAISVLQPALKKFLPEYPDIKVEIVVDYGLTNIVAEGFDAGVRMGEQVASMRRRAWCG